MSCHCFVFLFVSLFSFMSYGLNKLFITYCSYNIWRTTVKLSSLQSIVSISFFILIGLCVLPISCQVSCLCDFHPSPYALLLYLVVSSFMLADCLYSCVSLPAVSWCAMWVSFMTACFTDHPLRWVIWKPLPILWPTSYVPNHYCIKPFWTFLLSVRPHCWPSFVCTRQTKPN